MLGAVFDGIAKVVKTQNGKTLDGKPHFNSETTNLIRPCKGIG